MTTDSKEAMRILRERLKAENEKKNFSDKPKTSTGDNARYPFWSMDFEKTATVRFLPDHADSGNPWFWVAREVIRLPFAGVVGGEYPTDKDVTVEVPCMDMFVPKSCPIIKDIAPLWKTPQEEIARTYYKKKSWIFQGFVTNSPFEEAELPENPIRRFVITKQIFDIIEASLADPEMEDLPVDFQNGTDFRITKTKGPQFPSYATSSWSRRTRPLSENELIAVEQHGLFNLKSFLGRVPDADELAAIKELYHASRRGEPFDYESYGKYYRAYSNRDDENGQSATTRTVSAPAPTPSPAVVKPTPAPRVETHDAEDEAPQATSGKAAKPDAKDILEKIRNRTAQAAGRTAA